MRSRTRTGSLGVLVALALVLSQALTASAAPVRFGAKLTTKTQPSNASPPIWCDHPNNTPPHPVCTWVMNRAYDRGTDGHMAPKDGRIGRVRLISCSPGSFTVQVARRVPGTGKYKVVRNGPFVSYSGDPNCADDFYPIESKVVDFAIRKGDLIAIRTKRTGALRCDSGGSKILLFDPPLVAGGASRKPSDTDGCWMLIEWQYK